MNKKVLAAGAGKSGIQAANLLLANGEDVILYDGNTKLDPEALRTQLNGDAEIALGELTDDVIARVSYCVISPGISLEVPFVLKLKEAGIEIRSEIELAWNYEKGTVIGITGTNGKTTTTTLVGDIMKAWLGEKKAFTVGNIGTPYAYEVMNTSEESATTIELSSFQLETITTFHPHVAAILNITPDHLNRHHTMEIYAAVKERVTENQTAEDFCVLNYEDARLKEFAKVCPSQVIWFSGVHELENGYYLKDNVMYRAVNGVSTRLVSADEVHLVGQCNYENIMAAIAITTAYGVPEETILEVVREFRAVAHRIEFVEEINGVKYYDDSKGTNVDAAVQGIKAMTGPTYLIGGGYDKGSEYDDWVKLFAGKIKKLILIGVTKEKIAACCDKYGFKNYMFADTLEEAVMYCRRFAEPGEMVLLSPACASWDMFKSYEERGDIFKSLVRHMK